MKKNTLVLSVFSCFIFLILAIKGFALFTSVTFKDFDVLEGKKTHFWRKLSLRDKEDLEVFKKNYLKRYPEIFKNKKEAKIPKVVHFIWLGPKEFPKKSIEYVQSWVDNHPGWVFKFWTDDPSRPLPHPAMQLALVSDINSPFVSSYLDKTDNYGEKSDLIRYDILYREGGVYSDHDIECYFSLEKFVNAFDFFAGLEPPHSNSGIETRVFPCNALIAAKPFHPIMLRSIEQVQERWIDVEDSFPLQDPKSQMLKVFHRTFHSFTLATKEMLNSNGNKDMIFPASFFYPDPITSKKTFSNWKTKGLIYTSHKCDGVWKPQEKSPQPTNKLEVLKAKNRLLEKKYKQAKTLLFFNFVACGCCLYFMFKRKKGKRFLGA